MNTSEIVISHFHDSESSLIFLALASLEFLNPVCSEKTLMEVYFSSDGQSGKTWVMIKYLLSYL